MDMTHLQTTKEKFNRVANEQERKGIMKYGQPLNPLDNYNWLRMLSEEMVDGQKYAMAEQVKKDFVIRKIRNRTDDVEINHWLDLLEGVEE